MENTNFTIKNVRIDWANLAAPRLNELSGEEYYSCALLIPKDNTAAVQAIETAFSDTVNANKNKFKGNKLYNPLQDGDGERPNSGEEYPDYCRGHYILNVKSKFMPILVNEAKRKLEDTADIEATFYDGCICAVSLRPYAYNTHGKQGVGYGLSGVMKQADGEVIQHSRISVDDMFGDIEAKEDDDQFPFEL